MPPKKKRKKKTEEEKAAEKSEKQRQKDVIKKQKDEAKERSKWDKIGASFANGKEPLYYIRVIFDESIFDTNKTEILKNVLTNKSTIDWRTKKCYTGDISYTTTDEYIACGLIRFQWRKLKSYNLKKDDYMMDHINKTRDLLPKAILRMTYKRFKQLYEDGGRDAFQDLFDLAIDSTNIEELTIVLEGIKPKVKMNSGRNKIFCHQFCVEELMIKYFLRSQGKIKYTFTKDVKETAEYLGRATRALAENNWRAEDTFLSLIEVKKLKCGKNAKDFSPKDNFQQMLLQIPRIPENAVAKLAEKYKNIMGLYNEFQNYHSDPKKMLAKFQYPGKDARGKQKFIGPVMARKIHQLFCEEDGTTAIS